VGESAGHDGDDIGASLADPERFAVVFHRHFGAVHGFVARRLGRELADDLAGSVFVEAFAARERYDAERPDARPWLYGIATNLVRRHRRKEERGLRAYARAAAGDAAAADDPHDRLSAGGEAPRLAAALAALRPSDRDALLLFVWADLSYDEVAIALRIPAGTVRSRIHRARRVLREHLEASGRFLAPIEGGET
jgi:RNA polymerase sigma-70 factor (ECF subfamily)